MASLVVVDDIVEVKAFCSLGPQQGINVLHYRCSAIGGAGLTDQDLCTTMSAIVAPLYKAYLPTAARYEGLRLQLVWPPPVPVAVTSFSGNGAGGIATDPLPSQATMLSRKNTSLAGRRNRGRIYLPFWCESQSGTDGKPSAAAITLAGTLLAQLLTTQAYAIGGDSVTLVPVLWRRGGPDYQAITSFTTRNAWATQRRRSLINKGDVIGP